MLIFKHFIASLLRFGTMMVSAIDNKIIIFFPEPETWSTYSLVLRCYRQEDMGYLDFNPFWVENSKVQLLLFPNGILKFLANGKIFQHIQYSL